MKPIYLIAGVTCVVLAFIFFNPARQVILGLQGQHQPVTQDNFEQVLAQSSAVDMSSLLGKSGLQYLNVGTMVSTMVSDRFSAYEDLIAEGKIPANSKLLTDRDKAWILSNLPSSPPAQNDTSQNSNVIPNSLQDLKPLSTSTLTLAITSGTIVGSVTQSGLKTSLITNDAGFLTNLLGFTTDNLTQGNTNKYSPWTIATGNISYASKVTIGGPLALTQFTTNGGLLYTNASGQLAQLGVGITGQCLKSTSTTPNWGACAATDAITGTGANGQIAFFTGADSQSSNSGLFWDNVSQSLGIGTTTPSGAGARIGGSAILGRMLHLSGPDLSGIRLTHTTYGVDTGIFQEYDGSVFFSSVGNISHHDFGLKTGNQERLTVSALGRIGIGDTTPQAQLEVVAPRNASADLSQSINYLQILRHPYAQNGLAAGLGFSVTNTDNNIGAAITHQRTGSNSMGDLRFYTKQVTTGGAGPALSMIISDQGNVGIGTDNPSGALQIYDAENSENALSINYDVSYTWLTAGPGKGLRLTGHGGSQLTSTAFLTISSSSQFWLESGGNFYFRNGSGNTRVLFETSSGNVGIGTADASPGAKLDVAGTFRATGATTLSNYTTTGGLLYTNDSGVVSQLGAGTTGQCLTATTGAAASWNSCVPANNATGTGLVGRVVVWSGGSTQTSNNDFFWDNSLNRLGLGTTTPGARLDIASSGTTQNGTQITANSLTTGRGLNISSTSTALTTGGLVGLSWTPGSATTMTGDLFSLNIGPNGTAGSLMNLMTDGLSVFKVTQSQITANVPVAFMAAGDMSIAHDLRFDNSSSGNITSAGPLRIQAGESYNSSDLTLSTYNNGAIMLDSGIISTANNTRLGLGGIYTPTAGLHIRAGTAAAGTAPLKLTAGTSLATPEPGAIEYDGVNLYFTSNSSRHTVTTNGQTQTILNKTIGNYLAWTGATAPGLSTAGTARTYFDSTSNTLKVSENTDAYADIQTSGRSATQPYTSLSTNTTLNNSHGVVNVDTTGGSVTITLPSAVDKAGRQYTIAKAVASNTVNIATTSAQTISGQASESLAGQYHSLTVVSNGTNWIVVARVD